MNIELPEEPKQPEASAQKVSKFSVQEKPKHEEKKENVTVSKPFVQEKPKQKEIDIEEIMRKLDNHKIEYHDLASGYQPKYYTPEVAKLILERIKAKNQLKKEEEKK